MGKRCRLSVFSAFVFFLITTFNLAAEDFYIARLNVIRYNSATKDIKTETEIKPSLLFQQELINLASEDIIYRPMDSLPKDVLTALDTMVVTTTLDALAVCFFTRVDNLIYGTINIDEKNNYETDLKIYNRAESKIVYQVVYSNPVVEEKTYMAEIAAKLHRNLKDIVLANKLLAKNTNQTPTTTPPTNSKDKTQSLPEKTEPEGQALANTSVPLVNKTEEVSLPPKVNTETQSEVKETPVDNNRPLLIYLSGGYYFPIMDEWKDYTIPCVSLEEGIKLSYPWIETEKFDLIFQPGLSFNYSFALNEPDNPYYIHFHSITAKAVFELNFEFNNSFGFFIGGGPQYKANIIDYANIGFKFFTDIPYAFGVFGDLGFEFILGKQKTIAIGATNIIDFTFFASRYIDYKALLHLTLRV
jgi:hypothetical protein